MFIVSVVYIIYNKEPDAFGDTHSSYRLPVFPQNPEYGSDGAPQRLRYGSGRQASLLQFNDLPPVYEAPVPCFQWRSSKPDSSVQGLLPSCPGSGIDHIPLKFSECAQNLQQEPSIGGGGIYAFQLCFCA